MCRRRITTAAVHEIVYSSPLGLIHDFLLGRNERTQNTPEFNWDEIVVFLRASVRGDGLFLCSPTCAFADVRNAFRMFECFFGSFDIFIFIYKKKIRPYGLPLHRLAKKKKKIYCNKLAQGGSVLLSVSQGNLDLLHRASDTPQRD